MPDQHTSFLNFQLRDTNSRTRLRFPKLSLGNYASQLQLRPADERKVDLTITPEILRQMQLYRMLMLGPLPSGRNREPFCYVPARTNPFPEESKEQDHDILKIVGEALLKCPEVKGFLDDLKEDAKAEAITSWRQLSTGEKVLAVTQGALTFLPGGIMASIEYPEVRNFMIEEVSNILLGLIPLPNNYSLKFSLDTGQEEAITGGKLKLNFSF